MCVGGGLAREEVVRAVDGATVQSIDALLMPKLRRTGGQVGGGNRSLVCARLGWRLARKHQRVAGVRRRVLVLRHSWGGGNRSVAAKIDGLTLRALPNRGDVRRRFHADVNGPGYRRQKSISIVRTTLKNLQLAIAGTIVM